MFLSLALFEWRVVKIANEVIVITNKAFLLGRVVIGVAWSIFTARRGCRIESLKIHSKNLKISIFELLSYLSLSLSFPPSFLISSRTHICLVAEAPNDYKKVWRYVEKAAESHNVINYQTLAQSYIHLHSIIWSILDTHRGNHGTYIRW